MDGDYTTDMHKGVRAGKRHLGLGIVAMLSLLIAVLLPAVPSRADGATRIVVLGGTSAVSDAVAGHLASCTSRPVERVSGADRYATAAAVSTDTFPGGAGEVFVATVRDFPDGVAAGSPAALAGAPVLLTHPDTLPGATAAEIGRLGASSIRILGGTGAVSATVEAALAGLGTTDRLFGPDRFATAAAISRARFPTADTVYVATGRTFPDALAGAPAAARDGAPILLVEKDSIPGPTQAELDRLNPATTVVLGGTAAISNAVAAALPGTVTRLAGPDRYATAAAISNATFAPGVDTIYVATGSTFTDALAGSAAGGFVGGPVLLVGTYQVPAPTAAEIARLTGQPCAPFSHHGVALAPGDTGTAVVSLQAMLTDAKLYRSGIDGIYDEATASAVVAFHKALGLPRTDTWEPDDWQRLDGFTPVPPKARPGEPDRVEVDIGHQLVYLILGDQVAAIVPTSTGSGGTYISSRGNVAWSYTPRGDFTLFRYRPGWTYTRLGGIYNTWNFTYSFAVHGYPRVPTYPASHGCVRLHLWDSDWTSQRMWVGMPIHIWDA